MTENNNGLAVGNVTAEVNTKPPEAAQFVLDTKTGLLLPEGVRRRSVPFGFQVKK